MPTIGDYATAAGVLLGTFSLVREIRQARRRERPIISVTLDSEWKQLPTEPGCHALTVTVHNKGGRELVIAGARVVCVDNGLTPCVIACTHHVVAATGVTQRNSGDFFPQIVVPPHRYERLRFATAEHTSLRAYKAVIEQLDGPDGVVTDEGIALRRARKVLLAVLHASSMQAPLRGPRGVFLAFSFTNSNARELRTSMWVSVAASLSLAGVAFQNNRVWYAIAAALLAPVTFWFFRRLALVIERETENVS